MRVVPLSLLNFLRDAVQTNIRLGNASDLVPHAKPGRGDLKPPQPEAASAAEAAEAASAAPATPAASAAPVAASAASAAVTAVAAVTAFGKLYAGPRYSGAFLVEDIERRQADVGDFLLTESDFVVSGVRRRHNLLLAHRAPRMRRSPATMLTRRPPKPAGLCFDAFALKVASRAT